MTATANSLQSKPNFTVHRDVTGAPVAADAAVGSLDPADHKALDCQDWLTLDGYVKLTGGAAPTVTLVPLMLSLYRDAAGDLQEEYVVQGDPIGPLADGESFELQPFRGKVFVRISAVAGAPTNAKVLLAGSRADNREDR